MCCQEKSFWQTLAKKDNVWLDVSATAGFQTGWYFIPEDDLLDPLLGVLLPAGHAVPGVEGSVSLHDLLAADVRHSLKGVDVLSEVPQQQVLLLQ